MSSQQTLASGPSTPTWAPVQCSWCQAWGRFHFNAALNLEGNPFSNWIQTQMVDPTGIVCDICNARRAPPHSQYLQKVTKWKLDEILISHVAEYAYGVYARNSPTVLAENRGLVARLPGYHIASARPTTFMRALADFWYPHTPETEIAARMSISDNIMYLRNWLDTVCPICDSWNTTCRHPRPRFQIGGIRGITVSFDTTSPGLQALGMSKYCLHSGLRPITEAIIRLEAGEHENLFLELDHVEALSAAEISDTEGGAEGSEADRLVETRMMVRARFPRRDPSIRETDCPYTFMAIAGAQVGVEPTDGPLLQRLCPNCGRPTGYGNRQMVCSRCRRTGMCYGCANDGAFADDPICYPCQFGFQNNL